MPIIMEVFHPDRLVVGIGRGDVTAQEYAKFLGDIIQGGILHYRKIIDVTAASSSTIGKEQLLAFDANFRSYSKERRGPLAIVADPYRHEIADAFKATTSVDRPVEIFRSIHEARKWLASHPVGGSDPA
jgi:hypothetical protein